MLAQENCVYNVFCNDVALAVHNTDKSVDIDILLCVLNEKYEEYGNDLLLGELIFKHTTFVCREVHRLLDYFHTHNRYE